MPVQRHVLLWGGWVHDDPTEELGAEFAEAAGVVKNEFPISGDLDGQLEAGAVSEWTGAIPTTCVFTPEFEIIGCETGNVFARSYELVEDHAGI